MLPLPVRIIFVRKKYKRNTLKRKLFHARREITPYKRSQIDECIYIHTYKYIPIDTQINTSHLHRHPPSRTRRGYHVLVIITSTSYLAEAYRSSIKRLVQGTRPTQDLIITIISFQAITVSLPWHDCFAVVGQALNYSCNDKYLSSNSNFMRMRV